MSANALMVTGWIILLAGVLIQIAGERSIGTAIPLTAVVALIASRAAGIRRR